MRREITQKILAILKDDETLKTEVKQFHFGVPTKYQVFPLVYVKRVGGPISPVTGSKKQQEIDYHVVIIDRNVDGSEAEERVNNLSDRVEEVLDGNTTLDGLVRDSRFTREESESVIHGDYAVVGSRLTLQTTKLL